MNSDTPSLLIWGAGGHAKVVLDVASSRYEDIVFLDDADSPPASLLDRTVFPNLASLLAVRPTPAEFVIAIGNNKVRTNCFERALQTGMRPALLVHGSAVVSSYSSLGPGTVVMPKAVVNAGTSIGANCIINTAAVIEHDCRIGDHVHVSPSAATGGGVIVEDYVHIGMGAILLPKSHVGREAVVGAGAVVLKSVAESLTVVGVPARPIHSK